jgi:U3 small nucleolar RNA-associated protein 20
VSELPLAENETYFSRELLNWSDRNGTEEFSELREWLKPKAISLPMILFHLESIVKTMDEYLQSPSTGAAEPILAYGWFKFYPIRFALPLTPNSFGRLLGILARDMRNEFYPLFPIVLKTLVHKIDAWKSEPELLERLFETIAFIFKYLQKQMVKDIRNVFGYVLDLSYLHRLRAIS